MRIHDVSLLIGPGLPTWPGDPPLRLTATWSQDRGHAANVSRLETGVHVGTHVDAPAHFLAGGAGAESLPLDVLCGPCRVVAADQAGTELDLRALPRPVPERLLFKTRNSALWAAGNRPFEEGFVGIGLELADALVGGGCRLVGVDYLSVERFAAPFEHPVHRRLLSAGVVIVEGLDLSRVEPGEYGLYCLPLKLAGADGAPARAILVEPVEGGPDGSNLSA